MPEINPVGVVTGELHVGDGTYYVLASAKTKAFDAIMKERAFQDEKHGHPDDNPHSIGAWLMTIEAELAEAKAAAIKGGTGRDNVINEIIQIAALCVACLEQHGVEEFQGRAV